MSLLLAQAIVEQAEPTAGFRVIQVLLFGGCLILFVYVLRSRSLLMTRLMGSILFLVALVAIVFPGLTTFAAQALGVGRGADLVLYLSFLLFSYLAMVLFEKQKTHSRDLTKLVRTLAHQNATRPEERKD